MSKRVVALLILIIGGVVLLAACAAEPQIVEVEVTRVITETVTETITQEIEVTRVVEGETITEVVEVQVEVPAEPAMMYPGVVIEGIMIGLISWAAAVVLSFPISYLLLRIIGQAMLNGDIPLQITMDGFLIWLGLVILLSVVASILPARSAARLTIREVLAYE